MKLPDTLLTVFSAEIRERDDAAVITLPERELELGDLERGRGYRVAVVEQVDADPDSNEERRTRDLSNARGRAERPVERGERCQVEIEDIGEKGDGIARVGPGYIVFVADTDVGDRVTVEISEVKENFGFAEVVEDEPISP